jgi:hypothetical protein
MTTKTKVKAGGLTTINHNEGMKVKSGMRAGKRTEVKDAHDR